jgi:hypothetical protein
VSLCVFRAPLPLKESFTIGINVNQLVLLLKNHEKEIKIDSRIKPR